MIGDGWDNDPSVRPHTPDPAAQGHGGGEHEAARLRVAVVTGTRAEFGLLKPVMLAIHQHPQLELAVIASGSHLIAPAETFHEVKKHVAIADVVPMQVAGRTGRHEDVESLARGVARFGRSFERLRPDWVLVLGDRIEAFAAGIAASVGGYALAHVHGGDRAEGIADESMRHALTKLAALHFPATPTSAERIIRMGEDAARVHLVGSPAMDELATIPPLGEEAWRELGSPTSVMLMHPVGQPLEVEEAQATTLIDALLACTQRVVALMPNADPGREGIVRALTIAGDAGQLTVASHLPRETFVGLLKRLAALPPGQRGVLAGNSSAGLIEAAALRVPVVDIGSRQGGRERCANVVHVGFAEVNALKAAIQRAQQLDLASLVHPYGDGKSAARIASVLAGLNPRASLLTRKRCAY